MGPLPRCPFAVSAVDLSSAIPRVVSDIVMKLLAKLPEDRYQSMHGVQFDLDRCIVQRQANGSILPFVLRSEDFSGQFYIPRKLYGREQEVHRYEKLHADGRDGPAHACDGRRVCRGR